MIPKKITITRKAVKTNNLITGDCLKAKWVRSLYAPNFETAPIGLYKVFLNSKGMIKWHRIK